ncbi:lantibiotic dehydratase family protein [Chryseobacterium salviniae]|uniref:Lantibiotic dehydratase family protein n=1 Tax=Chryseobacterium salviniae TaxID=3101750 RepID=A0ABU6HXP9_9FLAO|nr:lantibiotic dehydratase family protein [Chryseobacterium sp. T9W2-O]MEC3877800.1 lantibiotic dehydratase family protein [Chryseobacterium sp. T9W2-O]
MPRFPYQFFDEFVVRTPLFSRKDFQDQLSRNEIPDSELQEICRNPVFLEALYLASPNLHDEACKWIQSEKDFSSKEFQKLKQTLLKYYSRISCRCTPFGLFSGVGLGSFDKVRMTIPVSEKVRDTKLDMHFLVALAQHFMQLEEIRTQLLFFPNNSIYKVGRKIRYVEYQYTEGKREYIISSAPLSEELQHVLHFSKQGRTLQEIAGILVNEQISDMEAEEFVEELISNQVLVSELEPNVSGKDFLDVIITVLSKIKANDEAKILIDIKKKLNELDQNIGNPVSKYTEIEGLIKTFNTKYDQKYLFQTDLYYNGQFILSGEWKKELKKAISFLNKITLSQKQSHVEKFKKAFYERFETQEMPLAYVLDTEIGIGYKQHITAKGIHPYLEDLSISDVPQKQALNLILNPVQKILNEKLQEALTENRQVISLADKDFEGFIENWNDLPDTISFMAEIISENGIEKLSVGNGGGSSAANLLGRFCSEKANVQNLTKTITQKEEMLWRAEHGSDEMVAEIIHLPEARIGNVIRRPTIRSYEIPYLAQSVLPEENQISVDDLYISFQDNRIVLRSKKLNKKVRPYLTNAHNYFTNTLPVYHFLSELNSENMRTGLCFDWGSLSQIYHFLPRVEYKNIILSKAQWKINEKDIAAMEMSADKNQALAAFKNWREKRKIPQWIQWVKSDNTLTFNLENCDAVKLFFQILKSEKTIIIEEFLYNENDDFKREFIFPMYKIQ